LERGGLVSRQQLLTDQGLGFSVRRAHDEERASLGDDTAVQRVVERVLAKLGLDRKLGAPRFVAGELEQRAAPRFRLVIGAEAAREGLGSVLTELARLLTSRFDEIVLGRHSLSPRSEIRARSARSVAARRLLLRLLVGRLQQVDLDELI